MASDERDNQESRAAALFNATDILVARRRVELDLIAAKEALERKTEELGQVVARLRATFESSTDAIFVTDREGYVTDYNQRFLALWGLAPEMMSGRIREEIREVMSRHVKDPAAYIRRLDEIDASESTETFDTLVLTDGRVFERHSRLQLDERRHLGRVWSFHEITSHRRAAAELREQREWFRVTLSSIGDAVITTDLEARVTFLNPVAEKMTGWSVDEARGRPLREVFRIIHEGTRQPVESPIARALEGGETVALVDHAALVSRGGQEIAIEDSAAPIRDGSGKVRGAVMVFYDVTERRRKDDALRESEARLRVSLETAALGTWELATQPMTVTLDERCQEVLAMPGRAVVGFEAFCEVGHPDDRATRCNELRRVARGEVDRTEIEFRIGLEPRWIKVSAKPVRDRNGAVVRVIGAVQDVTDLIQARATNEERRKELERIVAERTASLQRAIEQMEEFSYSVSHDLRAPLRSIQSYAQVVIEDFGEKIGPEGVEYLQRIVNAGRRMDRLTRDVLTYSKISRGSAPVVPLPLDRVVAETIEQYASAQRRDGLIEIKGPLHPVLGHEPLLVQAISNLLANAVKFVAEGAAPRVHLWSERRGPDVRLWVEDNGIGIRPEYQHRIWGMFERMHPRDEYDGTGIGLAITRKAVERMGGVVGVESDGVNGSRFWIQLRAG